MKKIRKFITNGFVQKWFFTLLGFAAVLFCCFMLYIHTSSTLALQLEYTSYSELQTERITSTLDDNLKSLSRVTSLLSINKMVRIYLFNEKGEEVFPDLYSQLYSQLLSYKEGFPAIDSIYLFPAYGSNFFIHNSDKPQQLSTLSDKNCLLLDEAPDKITLAPRKKDEYYPFLLTIYLPFSELGQKAMIVVNINLSKIPTLADEKKDSLQKIYIISDKGELLYRNGQEDIPEVLDVVPKLKNFDSTKDFYSEYISDKSPYIYVQQHSALYDWYYVTVTTPQSYIGKSYDFYSSLFMLLPWLIIVAVLIIIWMVWIFTHPMRTIMDFLDNPLTELPEQISEPETQKIIRQLINYVQANHTLSTELEKQMERQNKATYYALQSQINPHFLFNTLNLIRSMEIETLGFDHKAPEMTLTLSRLLQYALTSTNLVTLKTEFHYLELYLKILNQRYKEKLHFTLQLEEACQEIMVPKLILQPLIENAVYHGCSPQLDTHNTILVDARIAGSLCHILIKDTGIGMNLENLENLRSKLNDFENIPSDSIGLQNVAVRMHLTYGSSFRIQIDSKPSEGTCIFLSFHPANVG